MKLDKLMQENKHFKSFTNNIDLIQCLKKFMFYKLHRIKVKKSKKLFSKNLYSNK